ncbi:hypothetical protein DFH28DRAFT_1120803 [Melampsora americana]|nr:hypothetical protein DFH28DRAFT_1120803 [Melampsora americana]
MSSIYESESDHKSYCEEAFEEALEEAYNHNDDYDDEEEQSVVQTKSKQATSSKSSQSLSSKRTGMKGKKTFGLPSDRLSFTTIIDDNTTVDDKGYPLLPNGHTVYVKDKGLKKPANWGTFAFAYTTSGGGIKGDWRTTCQDTLCRMDEHTPSGWGIIQHSGFHQHRWPRRTKPDKLSLATFGQRVVANPDIGPLRHKVGRAPAGKQEIVTVTSIHPAFGNIH